VDMERRFLRIRSLLFYISILFLLTSCSLFQNKQAIVADTASTDLSKENIDGLVLGTNIKESSFLKEHDIAKDNSNSYALDDEKYGILTSNEEEITLI
jgi:hypothetical protein